MGRGLPYRFFDAVARYPYSVADVIGCRRRATRATSRSGSSARAVGWRCCRTGWARRPMRRARSCPPWPDVAAAAAANRIATTIKAAPVHVGAAAAANRAVTPSPPLVTCRTAQFAPAGAPTLARRLPGRLRADPRDGFHVGAAAAANQAVKRRLRERKRSAGIDAIYNGCIARRADYGD